MENQINYVEKIDNQGLEEDYKELENLKSKKNPMLISKKDFHKSLYENQNQNPSSNNINFNSQFNVKNPNFNDNLFGNSNQSNNHTVNKENYLNFLNPNIKRNTNKINIEKKNLKEFLFTRVSILTFINISNDKEMNIEFDFNEFPNKIADNYCIENLLKKFKLIENIDKNFQKNQSKICKIKLILNRIRIETEQNHSSYEPNKMIIKYLSQILFDILIQIYYIHKNIKINKTRFIKINSKYSLKNCFSNILRLLPFKNPEIETFINFFHRKICNNSGNIHSLFKKTIFQSSNEDSFSNFTSLLKKTNFSTYNHTSLLEFLINNYSFNVINISDYPKNLEKNDFSKEFEKKTSHILDMNEHLLFGKKSFILETNKCLKKIYKEGFAHLLFSLYNDLPIKKKNINLSSDAFLNDLNTNLENKNIEYKWNTNTKYQRYKKNKLSKIIFFDFGQTMLQMHKSKKSRLQKDKNYVLGLAYKYHDNYQEIISTIKSLNSNKMKEHIYNLEKKMKNSHLLDFSKDYFAKRYFDLRIKSKHMKLVKLRQLLKSQNNIGNGYYYNYYMQNCLNTDAFEEIKNIIYSYADDKNFKESPKFVKRNSNKELNFYNNKQNEFYLNNTSINALDAYEKQFFSDNNKNFNHGKLLINNIQNNLEGKDIKKKKEILRYNDNDSNKLKEYQVSNWGKDKNFLKNILIVDASNLNKFPEIKENNRYSINNSTNKIHISKLNENFPEKKLSGNFALKSSIKLEVGNFHNNQFQDIYYEKIKNELFNAEYKMIPINEEKINNDKNINNPIEEESTNYVNEIIIEEKLKHNREKNLKTLEFLSKKPNPHKSIYSKVKAEIKGRGNSLYSSNYNNGINIFENNQLFPNNNYQSENEKELIYDQERDNFNFCKNINSSQLNQESLKCSKEKDIYIKEKLDSNYMTNTDELLRNINENNNYLENNYEILKKNSLNNSIEIKNKKNSNKKINEIFPNQEEELEYSDSYSVNINNTTIYKNYQKEKDMKNSNCNFNKIFIPKINLNFADEINSSKLEIRKSEKSLGSSKKASNDDSLLNIQNYEDCKFNENEEEEEHEDYTDQDKSELDEIEEIYNKYNNDLKNMVLSDRRRKGTTDSKMDEQSKN